MPNALRGKLFVERLADFIAGRAGLSRGAGGASIELFAHGGNEAGAADPYSVLAAYPGSPRGQVAVNALALQVMTLGTDLAASIERAEEIFDALLEEEDGRPLRNFAIDGFHVFGVLSPRPPGKAGVDGDRHKVAFNFDVQYRAAE